MNKDRPRTYINKEHSQPPSTAQLLARIQELEENVQELRDELLIPKRKKDRPNPQH